MTLPFLSLFRPARVPKERNYRKTVKGCWVKKGVRVELEEHFWSNGCPQRSWRVHVKFTNTRWLTTDGILTTREEAYSFYEQVRRSFQ